MQRRSRTPIFVPSFRQAEAQRLAHIGSDGRVRLASGAERGDASTVTGPAAWTKVASGASPTCRTTSGVRRETSRGTRPASRTAAWSRTGPGPRRVVPHRRTRGDLRDSVRRRPPESHRREGRALPQLPPPTTPPTGTHDWNAEPTMTTTDQTAQTRTPPPAAPRPRGGDNRLEPHRGHRGRHRGHRGGIHRPRRVRDRLGHRGCQLGHHRVAVLRRGPPRHRHPP